MMKKAKFLIGICLLGVVAWWLFDAIQAPVSPNLSISQRLADQPNQPPSDVISGEDLPPEGTRSLFDHHVAQLGALPYPFSELLDSLKPLDRWGQGSVSLLIPDGRSLAKGHANYRYPRVLAAAQLDPIGSDSGITPIYSGRLFLGFVEAINTIEIIAYNEAAGRFEFQLVHDYCEGCTPRITYAKRDICMACHHSGSPIFSLRPWSETNAHPAIAQRIAAAQGVDWSEASSTRYHGVPLSTQITMPESFDELADLGSELILAQRVWVDGCGEGGLECRRALLIEALSLLIQPGGFNPASPATTELVKLQKAHWPESGIEFANDDLMNRNPPEPAFYAGLLHAFKRFWRELLSADQGEEDSAARLAEFEKLPRIPVELDPLTSRKSKDVLQGDSVVGVHAIAKLFSPHDREMLNRLGKGDLQRILQPIRSGELDALLTRSPLSRVAVLQQLGKSLGASDLQYCCLNTRHFSPPLLEDTQQLGIAPGSVLEVFERYCFACHRGNPVERLNFMGGNTEAEVLASIRGTKRIPEVLRYGQTPMGEKVNQLMPPPSSEQRRLLESALVVGSDDLQRMLDAAIKEGDE